MVIGSGNCLFRGCSNYKQKLLFWGLFFFVCFLLYFLTVVLFRFFFLFSLFTIQDFSKVYLSISNSMIKSKQHNFKANKNIKGFYRCKNCNTEMQYNTSQTKFTITRGGIIDNSNTRMNCFKLSKD